MRSAWAKSRAGRSAMGRGKGALALFAGMLISVAQAQPWLSPGVPPPSAEQIQRALRLGEQFQAQMPARAAPFSGYAYDISPYYLEPSPPHRVPIHYGFTEPYYGYDRWHYRPPGVSPWWAPRHDLWSPGRWRW